MAETITISKELAEQALKALWRYNKENDRHGFEDADAEYAYRDLNNEVNREITAAEQQEPELNDLQKVGPKFHDILNELAEFAVIHDTPEWNIAKPLIDRIVADAISDDSDQIIYAIEKLAWIFGVMSSIDYVGEITQMYVRLYYGHDDDVLYMLKSLHDPERYDQAVQEMEEALAEEEEDADIFPFPERIGTKSLERPDGMSENVTTFLEAFNVKIDRGNDDKDKEESDE